MALVYSPRYPRWMVDFYGKLVGIYTSPMDAMENAIQFVT